MILLGDSGVGKSTFLRAVNGHLRLAHTGADTVSGYGQRIRPVDTASG
jgi:ABC-type nitrate/sulfonate/bicarbonate transport system ATPase subunit